jgi:hypothetical protein
MQQLLRNSTPEEQPRALLLAGDRSPQVSLQGSNDRNQTAGPKVSASVQGLNRHRPVRFGLPCASCKAYYASDLPACPICNCGERVPAEQAESEAVNVSKKPPAGVLQGVLEPPLQFALRCDEDGKGFRFASRLLLCAHEEIDASAPSLCILDENHKIQSESASICLGCYEQLREKLAFTEAALLMDLAEAAQIVYRAVWADPSPTEPRRTYESAAQALLNELCHRAGIVRLPAAM